MQDWLETIVEELEKGYLSSEQYQTLLYYTFREAETCNVKQLIEKLQNIRTYEEETMSIADQIEQLGLEKGLQQGLQRGLQRGLQQGREESRLNIAKNMLAKRFNLALIKEITGLSDQDLLSLEDCSNSLD